MDNEPKLIDTWDELKECTSETHNLEIDDHSRWINLKEKSKNKGFFKQNHYLFTHTSYGSQYKISTKLLQKCGFNV